jgi:inhibitor of cysteine peptidase
MKSKLVSMMIAAVVTLGAAALVSGCTKRSTVATATTATTVTSTTRATNSYTEADTGRTITVRENERFTVRIRENPTTGFQWKIVLPESLRVVEDRFEPSDTSKTPAAGAGGIRVVTFAAIGSATPGSSAGHLVLNLERSWESAGPIETLDFPLVG